ncbi:MAG: 4Fe-4S binding protein [Deltaproteobacteria bacterium]|nr:4Fe-4S binding protein [Deltaproteobacteria bacterium]MBW2138423.1 4Fe-4S binding protein [Deltaproteobacteria bacterium]
MKWSEEAEEAIKRVPFFVRKRVRARVEEEIKREGKKSVSLGDLREAQRRFLSGMSDEVKGYRIETCFGSAGCPNRAMDSEELTEKVETCLQRAELRKLLEERVPGTLKPHHEFRVAVADCPNACSQPQIRDVGIIGACEPTVTGESCSGCGSCVETCIEGAVVVKEQGPLIDGERCLRCGTCIEACPTATLAAGSKGFRVLLGGKLGRHPRLAREMDGLFTDQEVVKILERCLDFYRERSLHGERFAEILKDAESIDMFMP